MSEFPSDAERYASAACDLPAFGGLSLAQTRKDLQELLGKIGSFGFFDEYTKHDITHIDAMLGKLDWLVTAETRAAMTPADWLLIVLAVYFHDLGMLVTKNEYERREESEFPQFKAECLQASDSDSRDYLARLNVLSEEGRERFLYQEFVRHHHAARVRKWIVGDHTPNLGAADAVVKEMGNLLRQVDPVFRDDLAKVCESHHLDDLYDVSKYPVDWYYGSSERERANVQFAAILLRTVDLLHITSDRTPSVAFRVFNPADPISQNEWAKQAAVKAVVAKKGVDRDGVPSDHASRDTIQVYATFTDSNGYFALTSYLKYAADQLQLSFEWAQRSNDKLGSKYEFPWRVIDTDRVVARGFLKEPFRFTIDRQKILDLLTGHTLYNDTNVVLRELLQNSIDAVRLQYGTRSPELGRVEVHWDSAQRVLEICDNGTGMTQGVIENNLLRAGSSRYQEPEFRKRNPDFNPISRFGIGVLSTFMVADQVEITTCHPEEEKARQLSLRSVHGQYLVRTLDKNQDVPERIRPHGTIVRLTLRPSAELRSVTRTARHFVVLPECKVTVREDGGSEQGIGYATVGEALTDSMVKSNSASARDLEEGKLKIVERRIGNASIAYALQWSEYFREWTFSPVDLRLRPSIARSLENPVTGVCVAGVRVEGVTPGFRGSGPIAALANTFGANSPRTNAARSALDSTPERDEFIRACYEAYCGHVIGEIEALKERGHSITWATQEASYIASPLRGNNTPVSPAMLGEAVRRIPFFLVEEGGARKRITADELLGFTEIETVESAVTEHVEHLLRELPGGTRGSIVALLGGQVEDQGADRKPVLCTRLGRAEEIDKMFLADWEIGRVVGDVANRTCSARWVQKGALPRWTSPDLEGTGLEVLDREIERYGRATKMVRIPIGDVDETGFEKAMRGFIMGDMAYLLPGHPWQEMVDELKAAVGVRARTGLAMLCWLISKRMINNLAMPRFASTKPSSVAELQDQLESLGLIDVIDWPAFTAICRSEESAMEFFDTRKWQRGHRGY
ncbi:ATP-binding protein [Streptomyces sp. XY431]|uniref:HD domain-containing protein n=1 Tax=Streptomyces sp. XY431 TaxID=1415562 RepID=UPI000A8610DB|nr:ATP-binding protein [Streptomyces sp. XY431]